MFLVLPEDLSIALLSEWLEDSLLADLSHLDVAYCNRASRACWLQITRQMRIDEAGATQYNVLTWLHARQVLVSKLTLDMAKPAWTHLSALAISFRTSSLECHQIADCHSIQRLPSIFPHLTSLDLNCHYTLDRVFPKMAPCWPLRRLRLVDCWDMKVANASVLLAAVSATLEDLYGDPVVERMMMALVKHCRGLKKLDLAFRENVTAESIIALCVSNCQLSHVIFDGEQITREVLLLILSVCPWIREVTVSGSDLRRNNSISWLLSLNDVHNLDFISVCFVECRYFPCEEYESRRCCEIVFRTPFAIAEVLNAFLQRMSLPIRGVTICEVDFVIPAGALRSLAEAHGHTLKKCKFHLKDDTQPADMQHFLSHCPNMVDLSLTFHGALIDDADMRNLPLWCPQIRQLELIDCAVDITDASLSYALERWATNIMTALSLRGCRLLTDAVLLVIERCCPQLAVLRLPQTNFSKQALLQFVLSISKSKVFSLLEAVDSQSRDWIAAQLKRRSGLGKRE